MIQRGDVLHCDVGITGAPAQHRHAAHGLRAQAGRDRRTGGPAQALANANALQDIAMEEIRPGRTGNEILAAVLSRMRARGHQRHDVLAIRSGCTATARARSMGLWDYQDGVPGRGDAR